MFFLFCSHFKLLAFVLRLDETAKAMVEDEPWEDDEIPDEFQGGVFCFFIIGFILMFVFARSHHVDSDERSCHMGR